MTKRRAQGQGESDDKRGEWMTKRRAQVSGGE
jgi:hypothetical protein